MKSRKRAATRWRTVRRLTKMQPHEVAHVTKGANRRSFAVIKEDMSMLPTLDQATKAQETLTKIVEVLKSGTPDQAATEALHGELDTVLDLIGAPETTPAAGSTTTAPIGDTLKKVLKDLAAVSQEAQGTDYVMSDRVDAIQEAVQTVADAVETANTPKATDDVPADATPAVDPAAAAPAPADEPAPAAEPAPAVEPAADEPTAEDPEPTADEPAADADPAPAGEDADTAPDAVEALPATGKPGGFTAAQPGCPTDVAMYADPNNFLHPLDTKERVELAQTMLSHEDTIKNYTEAEIAVMNTRITAAAEKYGVPAPSDVGITKADLNSFGQSIIEGFKAAAKELTVAKAAPAIAPPTQVPVTTQVPTFVVNKAKTDYDPVEDLDLTQSPDLAKMDGQGIIRG